MSLKEHSQPGVAFTERDRNTESTIQTKGILKANNSAQTLMARHRLSNIIPIPAIKPQQDDREHFEYEMKMKAVMMFNRIRKTFHDTSRYNFFPSSFYDNTHDNLTSETDSVTMSSERRDSIDSLDSSTNEDYIFPFDD